MGSFQPNSLTAIPLAINGSPFRAIQGWNFPDEPFYVRQVRQMLITEIPHLVIFENCSLWGYIDRKVSSEIIGFGTLTVSKLYSAYCQDSPHYYIPLLAVKPNIQSFGYGQSIVEHLIAESAINHKIGHEHGVASNLFLDVYQVNERACRLYEQKCNFTCLNPNQPLLDTAEDNQPYLVMAKNIAVASRT